MPIITRRFPHLIQPQYPVRVDKSSQQAKDLLVYWPFNLGDAKNLIDGSNNGTLTSGMTRGAMEGGTGLVFDGASQVDCTPAANVVNQTAITLSAFVKFNAFTNAYNTLISCSSPTAGLTDIHVKSTGKLALYLKADVGVSYDGNGANTLSTGVLYHIALTYDSVSGLVGYVNGEIDNTVAAAGPLLALTGTPYFTVGNNPPNATARFINGTVYDVRNYGRALSQAEIRKIYRDKWQLLEPLKRNIYVSAASGTTTGTIASVLDAFTSSMAGTTTVLGTIAQTLANATSAFTGGTTVTGTIAVTTEDDTSSMSGTTAVVGTLDASTENATSNITGTTTVLGQMAASVSNFIAAMTDAVGGIVARLLTLLGVGS